MITVRFNYPEDSEFADPNSVQWKLQRNRVITIAVEVSPSTTEQFAFGQLVHDLSSDGTFSVREQTAEIMKAILDGLQHGNWPKVEN